MAIAIAELITCCGSVQGMSLPLAVAPASTGGVARRGQRSAAAQAVNGGGQDPRLVTRGSRLPNLGFCCTGGCA